MTTIVYGQFDKNILDTPAKALPDLLVVRFDDDRVLVVLPKSETSGSYVNFFRLSDTLAEDIQAWYDDQEVHRKAHKKEAKP